MPKDNRKVLDVTFPTKKLQSVRTLGKGKETPEYEQLLLENYCPINHEKSSGLAESAGAV